MTNSNKILLSTLLNIEASFNFSESYISQASLPFSIHFNITDSYDLFQVIISAFSISDDKYENLYNLLEDFSENKISTYKIINEIEKLI